MTIVVGVWLASCGARLLATDDGASRDIPVGVQALFREGRLHEAIELLKGHLQNTPLDTGAQRNIVHASFRLGDYHTAAAYAAIILSDHPADTWARKVFSLSIIFLQDAMDPNDARALLALGRQCVSAGAYAVAAPVYRRYLSIVPEDTPTRKEYARLLSWSEPLTPAITEYRRILERNPGDDPVRLELARLMNRVGMHTAAAEQLKKLLKPQPKRPGVREELARALAWDGDNAGCIALLRELAKAPTVLEPESLPFLADVASRLACPVEERVFLVEAERVGVATPAMRVRLEVIASRSIGGGRTSEGVAATDANFGDFWRLIMDQRKTRLQARGRIGSLWSKRNPADLASTWETAKTHELLEQNDAALACYTQVAAASSTPFVWAHVRRLQALVAAGSAGAASGKADANP
jgi:thioredoxin-like negative regulator of GroEL